MRRTTANDCRHKGNFRWIIRFGLWLCYLLYFFAFAHFKTSAHSYEYFEDHEELSYDLDTAQSQAKYDARMLSEQMLSEEQERAREQEQPLEQREGVGQEQTASEVVSADEDDLQPHGRAASCYTNGRKYTHGQKVPRLDACEVCLCMDGEIFCWWEKCDKNKVIQQHQTDYSDPYHETTTKKSDELHQMRTTREPTKWFKHMKRNHGNELKTMQHKHKQKLKQTQKQQEPKKKKKNLRNHFYKSQREIELNDQLQSKRQRKLAQHVNLQQQQQPKQQVRQHQQLLQTEEVHWHEHHKQHHSASKILDFPANLPALLYYDYKTEEHEHHQHQHHQQHIMHQQQRLKQQKQQKLLKQQQQQQQQAQRHYKPMTPTTTTSTQTALDNIIDANVAADADANADAHVDGDDNDAGHDDDKHSDDAEIDSDILPEPPTKRPKATIFTTGKADTTTPTVAVATTLFDTSTLAAAAAVVEKPTTTATATTTTRIMSIVNEQSKQFYSETALEAATSENQLNDANGNKNNEDNLDDAFHRWLTSTELIAEGYLNNYSTLGDNLTQQATTTPLTSTSTSTVTMTETTTSTSAMTSTTAVAPAAAALAGVDHVISVNNNIGKVDNKNERNNKENVLQNDGTKYAIIRSTETDYSSEANGSVVKIDISLTTVDEQQQQQQQQQIDLRAKRLDKDILKTPVATTAMNASATVLTNTTTSPISSTASPDPSRQCSVMGTMYNIGDILPQDTGNCLQCICIDGSTADDTPRVTCSPHNCPPLVLPDLLDATGY